MLFKPRWYYLIRPECKPDNYKIAELESARKYYEGTHEKFMEFVVGSPITTVLLQKNLLAQAKREMPNVPEKELWGRVLLSRITNLMSQKLDVPGFIEQKELKPFANYDELNKRLTEKIEEVVLKCRTFDDVCKYIIELDEKMDNYKIPSEPEVQIANILEDKNNRLLDHWNESIYFIRLATFSTIVLNLIVGIVFKSIILPGFILLFEGIVLLSWLYRNKTKDILHRPTIFGNAEFLCSFPLFCYVLIMLGIIQFLYYIGFLIR